MRRKLIETLFPVAAVSAACIAEANRRNGQPRQLHPYWARRPHALARATILAQILDDPSSRPDRFPTRATQDAERARLVNLVESLAAWDPADSDDAPLQQARAEIQRHLADAPIGEGVPPPTDTPPQGGAFHDPFAGAGAIAIEANRLGLNAQASDLNPLAALLSTVCLDFSTRFAHRVPVGNVEPKQQKARTADLRLDGAPLRGLAHDVVHYGAVLFHLAQKRVGHLYPNAGILEAADPSRISLPTRRTRLPVIAWIWARTIPSPNPAFAHVHVPLISTFVLDARPAEAAHLTIDVDGDRWTPRVVSGPPKDRRAADLGTRLERTTFRCILSGTPITFEMIDAAGRDGRLGTRLIAIVAMQPDGRHAYLAPDDAQIQAAARATRPADLPDIPIHDAWASGRSSAPRTYGLNTVGDLFTDRQALTATTLCDLVTEVRDQVLADATAAGYPAGRPFRAGGSDAAAYADAVATLLALAISRYLATGNALAPWHPTAARVRDAFARPGLTMAWDFAEVNPFVSRAAGLRRAITQVADGLTTLPAGNAHAFMADARTAPVPPGAIITADPPYYDAVRYADLSDFFYAWLRRPLRHLHPDLFATLATPQGDELIVSERRDDPNPRSPGEYEHGLAEAFRAVAAQARPDVPLTCITTVRAGVAKINQSGRVEGPIPTYGSLAILVRAGLQVTAVWPIRTEPRNIVRLAGADDDPAPAIVAARRRPNNASTISVREFAARATPAITATVTRLRRNGVPPSIILVAALGPGLEIATGAEAVVAPDGQQLDLGTIIARTHDTALSALERADDGPHSPSWEKFLVDRLPELPGRNHPPTIADRLRQYASAASLLELDSLYHVIVATPEPINDDVVPPTLAAVADPAAIARAALEAVADLADGTSPARIQALGPLAQYVRDIAYRAYARAIRFQSLTEARAIDDHIAARPPDAAAQQSSQPDPPPYLHHHHTIRPWVVFREQVTSRPTALPPQL